jgi:hypothetical protein
MTHLNDGNRAGRPTIRRRQSDNIARCNRFWNEFCLRFEGGEDGFELAGAEGAEDLGFEVADGGGAGGESGDGFFAGGLGKNYPIVFAHGPEEFDDADAELSSGFLGSSRAPDRIDDVTDSFVGVLKQQDVAGHGARSFGVRLRVSHNQRWVCNYFFPWVYLGWRVESRISLCFSASK